MVDPKHPAFDRPEIFLTLGLALIEQGKVAAAHDLIAETLASHAANPLYRQLADRILGHKVPIYHGTMLADAARNTAYRRAIEAAAPGRVVLDIGTGSGLLAMIAARAGAARVIACEANPLLAQTARRIIAANGLADRIEVHACHSSTLDRQEIAPMGVDLVVSEIFSADLLEEGVLRSLEHARTHLCAPGALFIPESAALRVALVDHAMPAPALTDVEGFDLSAFAGHVPAVDHFMQNDPTLILRSDPAQLLHFDFASDRPLPIEGTGHAVLTATGGMARGLAQWLWIGLDHATSYENGPSGSQPAPPDASHWSILHHHLPTARDLAAGTRIDVEAWYCGEALALWTA